MSKSLEKRVGSLESKLKFLMTTMRMKALLTTGVLGSDGKPIGKTFDGSMLELYHLMREVDEFTQESTSEAPELSAETING